MNYFGHDPEAIYQDADILQAQYEAESAEHAATVRAGLCPHTGGIGTSSTGEVFYAVQQELAEGEVYCTGGCDTIFSWEDWGLADPLPVTDATKAATARRTEPVE